MTMTNDKTVNLPDKILFLADAHLGMPSEPKGRDERMAAFLESVCGYVSHVYIVGDLFDFWFEYSHAVPNIAPKTVCELYNLVKTGTKVTIFGGNHDFWIGPYLTETIGVDFVPDELVTKHQGKTIFIHHGDGYFPHDHGYRLLKKVLRSPISIFLFRLLHPDFARWLATATSKTSRDYLAPPDKHFHRNKRLFREVADELFDENPAYDAVVFGHGHVPLVEQREKGNLILLGDWIKYSTYVILENGTFTLHNWETQGVTDHG